MKFSRYNFHLANTIIIMFTKRDKKQNTTGNSDFHEFLKVLEDIEGQGDHVAIGIICQYLLKCQFNFTFINIYRFFSYQTNEEINRIT